MRTLLQQVARGSFSLEAAVRALWELGRGDVAAMLFATSGQRPGALRLADVQREARDIEMRMIVTRDGAAGITKAPMPGLMSAFDEYGCATVRVASAGSVEGCHVLLRHLNGGDGSEGCKRHEGSAAYGDHASFERRWATLLRGLLDGWDWSNCVAAGGAVVRALMMGCNESATDADGASATFDGDVDLFFHGLCVQGVRERLKALERHVRNMVGVGHYAVLLTSRTVTIVVDGAPRLQVALGMWSCVSDVLSTCDVDCCGVGYDGTRVVMTGRAAATYASGVNVASASRHRVRGSIAYEMRLWKYAARHGFAVLDPLHSAADEVVVLARASLAKAFEGASSRRAARLAATELTGLRWLMAVHAGHVTPTEVASDLAVGRVGDDAAAVTTVADVVRRVTAKGYMESDNYGTHEEGYVVVQEGDDDADAGQDGQEDYGHFNSHRALFREDFANNVLPEDMDFFDESRWCEDAWRLPR